MEFSLYNQSYIGVIWDNVTAYKEGKEKHTFMIRLQSCNFGGLLEWDKVFKSGLSKFCGRQTLKNLKGYGLLKQIF